NDGHNDLFVGYGGAQPSELWIDNGDGTFTEAHVLAGVNVAGSVGAVAAADVDNDDDTDLLVLSADGLDPRLFLNDGDGTFIDATAAAAFALPQGAVSDAVLADLNGDGRSDLLVTYADRDVSIHLNAGSAAFRSAGDDIPVIKGAALRAYVVDMDGDGLS